MRTSCTLTRQNIIDLASSQIEQCGKEYTHYAVTGHFGDSSIVTSRQGYSNLWQFREPMTRGVFSRLSRKFTGVKRWGVQSRDREMKVFVVPEIQEFLHLHGILSVPLEDSDRNLIKLNTTGMQIWQKTFGNDSFYAERLKNDDWMEYGTKTFGFGDIITENFMVLPFIKRLN